ncbi:MAG: sigma-70 family RNA polymerase sigma factor [Methanothrix sp.]|nr:sigma-70 family RNA polymerase sigma factor [Methanothrix sp.]
MKTMADVRRIVDLYELHKSYKKVARELNISRYTVKKHLHQVKDVQEGLCPFSNSPYCARRWPADEIDLRPRCKSSSSRRAPKRRDP